MIVVIFLVILALFLVVNDINKQLDELIKWQKVMIEVLEEKK
jgi:predicted PurR-regulated permease PerM